MAVLSTLRLLRQIPDGSDPAVACITFACPAIGNGALAEEVQQRGWGRHFKNFLIPGQRSAVADCGCLLRYTHDKLGPWAACSTPG